MNRNENEAESFAGNFMAFGEEALFFEVPLILKRSVRGVLLLINVTCGYSRQTAMT